MTGPTLVKICGVRTLGDVDVCLEERVDFIGLNLYPPSPRSVGWELAQSLRQRLTAQTRAVAVMVRPSVDDLRRATDEVGVDVVQIHGADEAYLRSFQASTVPIWLAHGVAGPNDLKELDLLLDVLQSHGLSPAAILVDAKVEGIPGGTGRTAPWSLLAKCTRKTPHILAGGLTPANVNLAISTVHPYAVDVAGGVEKSPGIKDHDRIRAFVHAVRTALSTKQGEESSSP